MTLKTVSIYLVAIALAVAAALGVGAWLSEPELLSLYAEGMRAPLFSALLAAAGIIVAVNTYIATRIEGVLTTANNRGPDGRLLAKAGLVRDSASGFRRSMRVHALNMGFLVFASIIQMTVGLIPKALYAQLALGVAAFAVCSFGLSLMLLHSGMLSWQRDNELNAQAGQASRP
jgi:hypothetical protein